MKNQKFEFVENIAGFRVSCVFEPRNEYGQCDWHVGVFPPLNSRGEHISHISWVNHYEPAETPARDFRYFAQAVRNARNLIECAFSVGFAAGASLVATNVKGA